MAARKAVSQELTKEIILDAARDLFVEKGYQSVSMRQIAKKLDYSHGAIYYHFKNKAEMFYELVKHDFILLDEALGGILQEKDMTPNKKLEAIFHGYIQFGLTHQSHYEIMFLIKDEEVQSSIAEGPNKSYKKFADAVSSLCDISLTQIWSIFLSLHGFVSHYCKSGQSYEDVKGLANIHVQMIMKSII